MRPKTAYALLCVAGALLPYAQLLPFLLEHGLDPGEFVNQLFASRISSFFAWDVIVATVVLWVFVLVEGRRAAVRAIWAPLAASLAVGVSLALPLFLYLRENAIENRVRVIGDRISR